ncbi:MAG: hypothetical protein ACO1PM_14740 [Acidovorax sp.]
MDDIVFRDDTMLSFKGKYASAFSKREARKEIRTDEKLRAQFCAPH